MKDKRPINSDQPWVDQIHYGDCLNKIFTRTTNIIFKRKIIMYNCYTFTVQISLVAINICFTFRMNANLCDNFTQHGRDHWTKKCGRRGWGRGIYVHFSLRRQKRLAKTRAKPGYGALCSREACTPLSGPDKSFPVTLIVYTTDRPTYQLIY